MKVLYATLLLMLAAWGILASREFLFAKPPWCARRRLMAVAAGLLVVGCLVSGIALLVGGFTRWMFLPIGLSYLAMLPLPCYFPAITATAWRRGVRNAVFVAFAAALIALGLGLLPLSAVGL